MSKKTALERDLQKRLPIEMNCVEYVSRRTLAVNGVQCEKYLVHQFDGTLATEAIQVKFLQSKGGNLHTLCATCADALMEHLAPSCNTGLNSQPDRETEAQK